MTQFEIVKGSSEVPTFGVYDHLAVDRQSTIEVAAHDGVSYEEAQHRMAERANFDPTTFLCAVTAGIDQKTAMAEATAHDTEVPPPELVNSVLAVLKAHRRPRLMLITGEGGENNNA